ncbi:hypothetical protein SAMN05421663_11167 [Terribacillus halophilus]|uniref:Uncharacterized protein n=1 Tax=Terribacillus halophilus TaxID=361279 RepID=A0A1G6UZH8_9BACI|nr:hypothetical protein [Terribacillus halophilus]SDD46728.1 hypothetical protein SAMN05421663_11167 [Terribacillus halophilus]
MAKTEEKDQNLEELVASVTQSPDEEESQPGQEESETEVQRIDVLNLPPRRAVHDGQRTGFRLHWNGSLARFILLTVIVLAVIGFILLYTDVPQSIPTLF